MAKCHIQLVKLAKPCIILNFDLKSYVFNVSEGFQRYLSDYSIKTKMSTQIFFTNLNATYINGIIGLLLTLNFDKQIDGTKIYGPSGLCQLFSAFRYSEIGGKSINSLSCHEFQGKNLIYQKKDQYYQEIFEGNIYPVLNGLKLVKYEEQESLQMYTDEYVEIVPIIHKNNNISYIIKTKKIKGSVSTEKLQLLKLTNIQKKELFQNHQIQLGDQIYPEAYFREPDVEEQGILVLDIIDDLDLSQIDFPNNLRCILHINDPKTEIYLNFLNKVNVDHILCNQEVQNEYSDSIPKTKFICNYLNSKYPFNFPSFSNNYSIQNNRYIQFQANYHYILHPLNKRGFQMMAPQMIGQTSQIKEINYQQTPIRQYKSEILLQFLGTASMRPNKYRNVSGILVKQFNSAILLDCGEGTFHQLQSQNNFDFNQKILIWISHVHCDHNLGIASFLQNCSNVYFLVPQIMIPWIVQLIEFYQIKHTCYLCYIPFDNYNLEQEFAIQNAKVQKFNEIKLQQLQELFNIQLEYVNVDHCPQAYGLRINFRDGSSISYSGDTRPCQQFIQLSKNVDLMIHEATFTDDLQKNAISRKHSTVGEAVESAILANAKTLILTHFSQRYCRTGSCQQQKIESNQIQSTINNETYEQYLNTKTVIALDFLSGLLDEYPNLVELSQHLQQLIES
ncbi:unnamed protein product (macronuclear) [Paramecium tetraurelia]|uniref:ribonuclease Z n=1 Tax=Paramecium tetraurelia TaxID=5888 RepID=Q6BGG4_PARTE|nr:Ribonuclease Z [Paramecium tetraurelia strain d4-2]XP_001423453.1 uncharacterized protein GSPATT00000491001 [Paramecium tetraurelia]CAH03256.1 Ribonuclease Z, putative [Paramecium tetraurelia]CAK56055.1 unnamed protein product [Paramecium tetraurelia]|eukprot:XP_001423453.1 hypothetical protein (macronuclear) [Paramecium tetraurelia strain d4-2]